MTLKIKFGYDDSLDAFGIHGIGGIVGAIALVFFIRPSWYNGTTDWGMSDQLLVQLAAVGCAIAYSSIGTLILVWGIDKTIGLKSTEEEEMQGLDHSYHGERGYGMLNPN